MTLEQIRFALDSMEHNYSLALDAGDDSLANAFYDKIVYLTELLILKTTEGN